MRGRGAKEEAGAFTPGSDAVRRKGSEDGSGDFGTGTSCMLLVGVEVLLGCRHTSGEASRLAICQSLNPEREVMTEGLLLPCAAVATDISGSRDTKSSPASSLRICLHLFRKASGDLDLGVLIGDADRVVRLSAR